MIEACNPLMYVGGQEKSAAQKALQRPQKVARKRQCLSADKQVMRPQEAGCEEEKPQESKEVRGDHGAPTNKKPRLSKQQLRELFSSSSEHEEVAEEESAGVALFHSGDHAPSYRAAAGTLLVGKKAEKAVKKLAWLARQPEVRPGVVASFVRRVKRDALIHAALLYLSCCKANPLGAYCRGELAPPLMTELETLLLKALALKRGGWAALLSSLRARFWSPQRPAQMLAQASYVRLLYAACSQLKDHEVALVTTWDLLYSGQAPFLVASAVGAWPGLLSALPPGPLQKAVGYILLRSPVHTLNSTLHSQACKVLSELGPLPRFEGDVQTLVEELLGPLLPPHSPCKDTASSTATCAALFLWKNKARRLPLHGCSTTAEIAGLNLAIYLLAEKLPRTRVAMYCDSKALLSLQQGGKTTSMETTLLSTRPCCSAQVTRSCFIRSSPTSECPAMRRLTASLRMRTALTHLLTQPSPPGTPQDIACDDIYRHAILTGRLPLATLPGLFRRRVSPAVTLLLCLRIGCYWTAARRYLVGLSLSLGFNSLGEPETLEHAPLYCLAYSQPTSALQEAYTPQGSHLEDRRTSCS
ncbi:hypothetical protein HPB50_004970 [Hyalomma asiaticum]|uniref:Uncharacterized protein n=1 Tax=Hyalomma asiaticum TaxID=266040 RepID=A0ACB7TF62_HYAAI|nr:hypothetical protein HPB50_004970 [Hyalomma asiaticum]